MENLSKLCFFCGEKQSPSGKIDNGIFYCLTCGKEHFFLNSRVKDVLFDFIEVLDVQVSFQEILKTTISLIQEKLGVSICSFYSYNKENNFLQLLDYQINFKTIRSLTNIRISLDEKENPIVQTFLDKKERWVELELYRQYSPRIFQILEKVREAKYSFLSPILFRDSPTGIFIVEFQNEEELHNFKKKISIYYFILKTFSYAAHNQNLYNRYKTKYLQFQNLHSSGLTLNKLYLNNTQEIIRMTLLTMGGLIDTNLNLLVVYNQKYKALTINKLIKDNYGIDLSHINSSTEEFPEIFEYFEVKEPKLYERKKIPFASQFGFTGVHALVLPSFELAGNTFCFILGRNSRKLFTLDEIEILYAYSDLVRITIDNSLMYHGIAKQERLEKEVEIATDIQMNLLPREIPKHEEYEFAGFMIPAREIGGDYYDFMQSPDGKETLIAIGDVSGKGIPAGMVMATARTILHSIVRKKVSLSEMLPELNSYLYHNYKNSLVTRFMSMILLRIESRKRYIQF
ncbi:MAG: SpoIIE family protein phosphatase, partial [Leptospiraceae bacterium]|nr:SpoIIE family protein phosphatase [Leptospiraceae bacterium]